MKIPCPQCGHRLTAPDGFAGRAGCPKCKHRWEVPEARAAATDPAPFDFEALAATLTTPAPAPTPAPEPEWVEPVEDVDDLPPRRRSLKPLWITLASVAGAAVSVTLIALAVSDSVSGSRNVPEAEPLPIGQAGDVLVRVDGAELTNCVACVDRHFDHYYSMGKCLVVKVNVTNASATRKYDYAGWQDYGFASLSDEHGNRYSQQSIRSGSRFFYRSGGKQYGTLVGETLHPGTTTGDAILFDEPVDAAKRFTLRLPKGALRGPGIGTGDVVLTFGREVFKK